MEIRTYLQLKLRQAFAEEWDPNRPSRVELVEEGCSTGLRFFVRRRDQSWVTVYETSPVKLITHEDVDDLVASALSVFLMKHTNWPR